MSSAASRATLRRVWPVQCYPKSIKTTLNRFFSCTMLSGASKTTVRRMSSEPQRRQYIGCPLSNVDPETTLHRIFFLSNVVWSLNDNTAQGFDVCNIVKGVLRQHFRRFSPVKYCLNTSETIMHKKITCAMLAQSAQTSFCKKTTNTILS